MHLAGPLELWLSIAFLTLALTGCGTALSKPTPTLAVQTRCPPLTSYSKAFMTNAAKELETLPHGSPTVQLINDYLRMRDICRKINLP